MTNNVTLMLGVVTVMTGAGCAAYTPQALDVSDHLSRWRSQGLSRPALPAAADPTLEPIGPNGPAGPPGQLTAPEAVRLALIVNPSVRALRLEAGAVELAADYAGAWDNPVLSAELRRAVDSGTSPWFLSAGLAFTLPLSPRHDRRREHAEAQASLARFEALAYERDLSVAVQSAWLDWSLAARREALLTEYVSTLSKLVAIATSLSRQGELALAELGVLPIEEQEAQLELSAARTSATERRHQVLALIGLAPQTPVQLVASLHSEREPLSAPPGWPQDHPRVQAAVAGYTLAARSHRLETARRAPDLTIGPTFEWDSGRTSVGVGVALPIPSFDLNRRAITETRGRVEAMRARAEIAIQALVATDAQARARAQALEARAEQLAALQSRVDAQLASVEQLARRGELDALLLRHALHQSLKIHLAIAGARRDLAEARLLLRALYEPPTSTPQEAQ